LSVDYLKIRVEKKYIANYRVTAFKERLFRKSMKPGRDLDVDDRVNVFNMLSAPRGTYTLIDTGVFGLLDFASLLPCGVPSRGVRICDALSAHNSLLHLLTAIVASGEYVLPEEVRDEYHAVTRVFEHIGSGERGVGQYSAAARARRRLFSTIPRLETTLNEQGRTNLETVTHTIISLSDALYAEDISLANNRAAKRKTSGNEQNDERILAKAFALSYRAPVRVVSADRDFIHLYESLVLGVESFLTNGVTSLPDTLPQLVYLRQNGTIELFDARRTRRRRTEQGV
jgi:hypothetical protein